jgi:hypothetical protein
MFAQWVFQVCAGMRGSGSVAFVLKSGLAPKAALLRARETSDMMAVRGSG